MSATVLPRPHVRPLLGQLARFGVVGAANTALTLATYAVLVAFHAPVPLAGAVGWGVGAVNGFVLNGAWTFPAATAVAS